MGNTAAVTGSIRAPLGILVGAVGIEQNALTFLRDYKRAATQEDIRILGMIGAAYFKLG